ncbi:MAG: BrnT family toxin [Spirochaetes bacterium]|nr:MAG: BrnT family toxin [Spirochaetota bacterium]
MLKYKYDFEWNHQKALSNISKHGISFNEAATVFKDPYMISIYDHDHSEYEDRWISIGLSEMGKLIVVFHTFREIDKLNTVIRLFSSRKATKAERKHYVGYKK